MSAIPASVIRVLCVDDHPLVLDGIAQKIGLQPDMRVVAVATDGLQALRRFKRYRPDVTLMDLQLPLMSGLDAIRAIRREDAAARIVVLTVYQGDEDIFRALESGAANYLLKDMLPEDLIRVVREVHTGSSALHPHVAERLAVRSNQRALTPREVHVLQRMTLGMRNKEIGGDLAISLETVQVHVRNILAKLGVRDRTAAATLAIHRGIVHPD